MVQTTVTITKPQSGARLNTNDVTVEWTAKNFDPDTQEYVVMLDGVIEDITVAQSTTLTNVSEGDHTVTVSSRESDGPKPIPPTPKSLQFSG